VWLASLVARRFGHRVSGVIAGLPMIAAPIVVVLLLEQPVVAVAGIVHGALACAPATLAFMVSFAHLTRWARWPVCLAASSAVFLATGAVALAWHPVLLVQQLVAMASPLAAMRLMPRAAPTSTRVSMARGEIAFRMSAALALGTAIVLSAPHLPGSLSGLMLAWPVTGSVLPCFTLARDGRQAAVGLLRGYVSGPMGFVVFFVVLTAGLSGWSPPMAIAAALLGAAASAATAERLRRRAA
jgi:hypothetical protein